MKKTLIKFLLGFTAFFLSITGGYLFYLRNNEDMGFVFLKNLSQNNSKDSSILTIKVVEPTLDPTPTNTPRPTLPIIKPVQLSDFVYADISKTKSIGTFVPSNLVIYSRDRSIRPTSISNLIVQDLDRLISAALNDGIDLKVVSGYRSYYDQKILFESYVQIEMTTRNISREQAEVIANSYSAKAGHSEHQLGTTVDVLSSETNYTFNYINENMKFVKWLENNVTKFNFHISYPKGNPEYRYEAWHIRWKA